MRTRLVLAIVLVVLMAPLAAVAAPPPVGEQISLLGQSPAEFEADAPFYVNHGWFVKNCGDEQENGPVGKYKFKLDIDGVDAGPGVVLMDRNDDGCLVRRVRFSFPDGLPAGEHTLTGHWYLPCQIAVDTGWTEGPCRKKNEPVVVLSVAHTMTFIDG